MQDISKEKLDQIWLEVSEDIEEKIGHEDFACYFSGIKLADLRDRVAYLFAPSYSVRDVIADKFFDLIIEILNSYGCGIDWLKIDVESSEHLKTTPDSEPLAENKEHPQEKDDQKKKEFNELFVLDKRFTFQRFVVGRPNEFAYAAAMRVAESESPVFNPLFLYGGVGLGKTHLMHATAWHIKELFPKKNIIYLSAEKFMYLFIRSLRFKDSVSFKEMVRTADILMIDDVQFIGGKDATQEEFFHTFNELVENNKQVILSADKSPSDLDGVEERLRSRLGWGLVADIHPTTYELRLGILQSKTKNYSIKIPDKVLEFLAFKITSNIRELEGALNRIVAHATLVGREISIDVAQDVLRDLLRSNEKIITIDFIQKKVCEYYGMKLSDLNSSKRQKTITTARHVAMYICKKLTTKSLPDIGRSFGGKDHATVIHAVKKVNERIESDPVFKSDLEILMKTLEN